jgi:hypothetical protein
MAMGSVAGLRRREGGHYSFDSTTVRAHISAAGASFDTIPHDQLMRPVARRVVDKES